MAKKRVYPTYWQQWIGKFAIKCGSQFFRQKLNLPTQFYDDILKDAHDRAFVVAGAMKADLLDDLRQAVDQAIADGKSIQLVEYSPRLFARLDAAWKVKEAARIRAKASIRASTGKY